MGSGVKIDPIDIKKGMVFRMFESTGEPVIGNNDSTLWEAISNAYINEDGITTIEISL